VLPKLLQNYLLPESKPNLRANLDGRPIRRDAIEFFDLFVGQRDAARGPIVHAVKCADPTESILNSVDHDVESGVHATLGRARVVRDGRIRDVK
jgi:hypothetical protein